ncbi:PLP-dependent aminotransferase family protein [Luteimonas sp. RD2P54]|uniref:PLP-dependent aminotransferase family protein n=1 Tax=Luteimonas endophytica TaxID=3042023 RepID=A0ABT6J6F4_9GAMM|nr:PLP-dependent aminotransferase family protein [Luteimonas endophytica]MDH5822142.1 PLP-dependent aminotransferase family protein [Luteimonas endophytica]
MILDGHGPLHAQVTRALKATILEGRLAHGSRLPATRWLATELGVSRNTVLVAYEQLRAEGFVEAKVGAGSFVALRMAPPAEPDSAPGNAAPQSAYARRARQLHDPERLVGRDIPGMRYSFQYGVPLVNPALTGAWARALAHAARYTRPHYPPAQGLPDLRGAVCDYLARRRGVYAAPEDVLIVAGTQQALALAARVLLDEGDPAAFEEPHYNAIRTVLRVHGARLVPVPVDAQGLRCELLPEQAPPRLICVTPSHQFPTGAVMSLERRMALLEYARRHGSWILEDDYDGEFRYDGRPLAALRSLDGAGRVIYVGTFSKALYPALRLGYMVLPPALRRDFVSAKWLADFATPAIDQAALAAFIADGGFERHLRRSALALRARRAVLLRLLRECGGGRLRIADSGAGMHLPVWIAGRGRADGDALIALAGRRGLGLYPIAPYYLDPPDRAGLLMGYAGLSVTEIEQGMRLFAACLDELFPRGSA